MFLDHNEECLSAIDTTHSSETSFVEIGIARYLVSQQIRIQGITLNYWFSLYMTEKYKADEGEKE